MFQELKECEDKRGCQTCELRYWGSWGSCDQQCGGDCNNGYYGDGCNSSCNCSTDSICGKETGACLPKVLSPDCEYGYYGDDCNFTCICQTDAICDKETGACLQEVVSSVYDGGDDDKQKQCCATPPPDQSDLSSAEDVLLLKLCEWILVNDIVRSLTNENRYIFFTIGLITLLN
ncbi:unnamed protein product [Mytilus edulis]|uniref:Uncharacterized protein n=1 Tax=Mytilus edulis TaxID=6550 RepID=A0A8S3TTE6_MYTED|nr:unnamed protein product [Mytilus edulis]